MLRDPAAVGRLFVLAAHAYPPESQYGTPRADFVRAVAHDLKAADPAAVRAAAAALAPSVPVGATLVPVPGARGSTRENLALAEALARLSGARVLDGLERDPSESQYARRKRGLAPLGASAMRVRWTGERPRGVVALVDNVVTTGATAEAARGALGGDAVLFAWADARGLAGTAPLIASPTDAERRAITRKARPNPLTAATGSRRIGRAMTLQRRPDGRYVASPANAPRRAALRSYHRDIGLLFSKGDRAGAMELIHAGSGPRANPSRVTYDDFMVSPVVWQRRTYGKTHKTVYYYGFVSIRGGDFVPLGDPWPNKKPRATELRAAMQAAWERR